MGERSLLVQRRGANEALKNCQMLFIPTQTRGSLARVLDELRNRSVLTVADSPGATQGVALNMAVTNSEVTFEAYLQAACAAHLTLSSKMLRVLPPKSCSEDDRGSARRGTGAAAKDKDPRNHQHRARRHPGGERLTQNHDTHQNGGHGPNHAGL